MATIKKKSLGKKTYYYIEHTYRQKGKIRKKEKYLGNILPKNLDQLKIGFLNEIYKDKWLDNFDLIKKNYHIEYGKIPESSKEKELEHFSIRFTYDSNRIEGSKLTLKETADLIERGVTPKEKPLRDIKEAEAHNKLFHKILDYNKDINLHIALFWHKELFNETMPDIAGKIRQHQVAISRSKFMPPFPSEVYPLLMDFFRWYEKNKNKLHPIELAALVHLKFVTIHPFADGNGRISRLMMNFVLNRNRFPMLNITYQKRNSYYNALERAQTKKNDSIFLQWFYRRYFKEYKKYLKTA